MTNFTSLIKLVILFVCFQVQVQAQQPFNKLYTNGSIFNNYNLANRSIISAPDNGCLIVGETDTTGILIRIDSLGNVLWNKTLNPPIRIRDIVAARDTSYYLIGNRFDSVTNHVILMKFNFHGGVIWSRKIQYTSYLDLLPLSLSIQATSDSGLVFCGNTSDTLNKSFVTKLDKNGNINWSNIFQLDNSSTIFSSISQTPDSGFVVIGSINQLTGCILKLNKAGNVSWCKTYFSNNYIYFSGKDILVHHNKLFAYFTYSDPLFVILDLSGNIISAKGYDLVNSNGFYGYSQHKLGTTKDGGFFMTHTDGYPGALIQKIDSTGNLIWYNKVGVNGGMAATQVRDEGYILIGNGPTFAAAAKSVKGILGMGIIKMDSSGIAVCSTKRVKSATSVTLSTSSATYSQTPVGSSQSFNITFASIAIQAQNGCLALFGGIHENSTNNQISVFPNPSSGIISISFENKISSPLTCHIINLMGQTVLEKTLSSNDSTFGLDCHSLPPSLYILQVSAKGKIIGTKQLIISP